MPEPVQSLPALPSPALLFRRTCLLPGLPMLLALLASTAIGQTPPLVELASVERSPLAEVITLPGSLAAVRDAQLSPRIEGLVEALQVDAGTQVEAGTVLLRLDDTLARLAVSAVEAEEAAAGASRAEAQRRVQEAAPLVAQRSLPETELAARRAALAEAEAALSAAQARLQGERERLARHVLRAPFAGVVAARHIDIGEWVTPTTPVLRLVDLTALRLEVQAPQERFAEIDENTHVQIEPDTAPGTRIEARIGARVPVSGASGARTFLLQVLPTSLEHGLLPGTSARARFELSRAAVLSLPRDALLRHPDGGYSAFVAIEAEDGLRAQRRPLKLGRESGLRVEVVEGLAGDERVVVRGNESLQDGQPIQARASGG